MDYLTGGWVESLKKNPVIVKVLALGNPLLLVTLASFNETNPYNFMGIATAGPQDALHKNRLRNDGSFVDG